MSSCEVSVIGRPIVEVFASTAEAVRTWPDVAGRAAFTSQLDNFRSQSEVVVTVTNKLASPQGDLEGAVTVGAVTEQEAGSYYDALTAILRDGSRSRSALYLPYQAIPRPDWQPTSDRLASARDNFRTTYRDSWYDLLSVKDVRANFVDGDVLEHYLRSGDLPRVVKAAHLIPGLLRRGLLEQSEITELYENTGDGVLRTSLAEGLGERVEAPLAGLSSSIVTERRRQWLDQQRADQELDHAAQQLARDILGSNGGLTLVIGQTSVEGIYNAIHTLAASDLPRAQRLYDNYQLVLDGALESVEPVVQARATQVYRRLHSLGIVDEVTLNDHGINQTRLDGPFSENLKYMTEDVARLKGITELMSMRPELAELLYPVVLLGGSRLKGYGSHASDVDVNVFVKPGVTRQITPLLDELFGSYEPIAFWLEDLGSQLRVKETENDADKFWTHTLFGSVWLGQPQAIVDLQRQLLPSYFAANDPDRRLYTERMEQDVLQYRLLHRGYARYNALATPGRSDIFQDPGYRRLATKLFASHVYLPEL